MDIGTNDLLTDLLVLVTFMYTEEKKKCFRHIDPVLYGLQCIIYYTGIIIMYM